MNRKEILVHRVADVALTPCRRCASVAVILTKRVRVEIALTLR